VTALSKVKLAQIIDGLAQTISVGEKHFASGQYLTSTNVGNDQGWDLGFDVDVNRWTKLPPKPDTVINSLRSLLIGTVRDDEFTIFGSAHPTGSQFVFCDGSVHTINHDVDPTAFAALGSIAGDEIFDQASF